MTFTGIFIVESNDGKTKICIYNRLPDIDDAASIQRMLESFYRIKHRELNWITNVYKILRCHCQKRTWAYTYEKHKRDEYGRIIVDNS